MGHAQGGEQRRLLFLFKRLRILIYEGMHFVRLRLPAFCFQLDPSHPLPFRNRRAIPHLIFLIVLRKRTAVVMSTAMSQSALVSALNVIQWTRICQLVPCVLVVYDHLLTLDGEVEYIWTKPFSFASILYLLVRYAGDAMTILDAAAYLNLSPSLEFCNIFIYLQGWPISAIGWCMQIILQLRVYALYNRSNRVLIFTILCYIAEIASTAVFMGRPSTDVVVMNEVLPGVGLCTTSSVPSSFDDFWYPVMLFEGILCALALWAGITHIRELRGLGSEGAIQGFRPGRVIEVFVRDNVFYFVCTSVICSVNVAVWQTLGENWFEIPAGFTFVAEVIMGCRLVLRMRESCYRPLGASVDLEDCSIGTIEFASA
ncbi:hypothetical protein BV22DRAFT_1037361 [Leucogyrophana mollusca]|uniref:Uncharacterized protein n=1 Tax=Leucogyrophana mollusca TaxID=85980 RepID=A0ACB8B9N8_9AGAM|nr:hypothetical protein BV22DRAFT_1037361 [Leucogyrophana mollusca]